MKKTLYSSIIMVTMLIVIYTITTYPKQDTNNISNDSQLQSDTICKLQENLNLISNIQSFCFIDKQHFVISTSSPTPSLFIYDITGKQLVEINKIGRGPGEFLNPSMVRNYKDEIYVWCAEQLKLIIYDKDGSFKREYLSFSKSINNFVPYENYVFFYTTGGFKEPFIETYDLSKNETIRTFGENVSNEHLALNLVNCSGGLAINKDQLLFTEVSDISIFSISINNWNCTKHEYHSPSFQVKKLNKDIHDLMNQDKNELMNYIYNNSLVTGLFSTDDYIILKTEEGIYKWNGKKIDNTKRYHKLYYFDKNFNFKHTLISKSNYDNNNSLFTSNNNELYYLTQNILEDNSYYTLNRIIKPSPKL